MRARASSSDRYSPSERRPPFRRLLLINPPMSSIGAEFMMEDVPLRLEYLAAYVRNLVDCVEVMDVANSSGNVRAALKKHRPDLVGISINYISTHANGVKLAKLAKEYGAQVVMGGYQATAMAEHFCENPDIDYVVRGEGEETLKELVSGEPLESVRGLTYKLDGKVVHNDERPLIQDLDSIPFPDRSRRDRKYKLPFADLDSNVSTAYDMLITSRGCWGRCTFCTEGMMTNYTQRYRKPEKVIEELKQIVELHKGKRLRVHIADPNFGGKRRITEELYDRLIEYRKTCGVDLHFFVSLRPSAIAGSRDLTKKMFAAGIDYLFVGMESPNNEELKRVLKGGETRERQETAAKYLREEGAEIMSNFLIGLPSQTPEDVLGLVTYAKQLELADCYFSVMTPLPGTQLYDEAVEKNLLLETDVTKYRLYDSVLKHPIMSRGKIREMCVRANAKWYDDLMLPAERRRSLAIGKKRKLYDFAGKFKVLVNFFSFIGSGANTEFAELDPKMMVVDMPNPKLREFTTENPIHEFIEMKRFLRILGDQRLQVTMRTQGTDVVSWVCQTSKTTVDYIDAVHGAPDVQPTVRINVAMDPGALSGRRFVAQILADNPTWKARWNLGRIAAAGLSEVARAYSDSTVERVRSTAGELVQRLKDRFGLSKPAAPVASPSAPETVPVEEQLPVERRAVGGVVPVGSLARKVQPASA